MTELSDITKQIRDEWYASAPEDAKKIYDEFLEAVGRKNRRSYEPDKKPGFSKTRFPAVSVLTAFIEDIINRGETGFSKGLVSVSHKFLLYYEEICLVC